MNTEARKLKLIERFLKFDDDSDIDRVDELLTRLEIQMRVRAAEADVESGQMRSRESFRLQCKIGKESHTIPLHIRKYILALQPHFGEEP